MKFTLFCFYKQLVFKETLQNEFNMSFVSLQVRRVNQDINIDVYKMIQKISQHIIYHRLKDCWGVCEAKRHN